MASINALVEYALSPEATAGTYVAPITAEFLPNAGGDFITTVEKVKLTAGFGRIEKTSQQKVSMLVGSGKLATPLGIENAGTHCIAIFGQAPTTTGSGTFTHTFELLNSNAHKSFSIIRKDPETGYLAFSNGMLDEFSFEAEKNGEFVVAETSWKSNPEDSGQTPVTPSYSTTEAFFTPDMVTVKIASNVAGLGAATAAANEKISIKVNKGVDVRGKNGSTSPHKIFNTRFDVEGSIDVIQDGDTDRQFALTSGTKAMQVICTSGTDSFTLELQSLTFGEPTLSTDLDGIQILTRPFTANRISTGALKAVLVNTKAAYPLT